MNAYDDRPKGKTGTIRLVLMHLSDGTTGLGPEGYVRIDDTTEEGLQALIGQNPLDWYQWSDDRIQGFSDAGRELFTDPRYSWLEGPVLDAIGKVKGKPVYALFGEPEHTTVDAYDGTLYFKDVEKEVGPSIIGEMAARIQDDGYGALKMKVGRPLKWMEREPGIERDIAAVRAAREAVGSNFNLMVDANNGYEDDLDGALRFLEGTAPAEVYWAEELLPEERDTYERLRAEMHDRGIVTRLAEGEDAFWSDSAAIQTVDDVRPWVESQLVDIVQPDLRTVGFTNVLAMAELSAPFGADVVPHNWQSELGMVMSAHAACVRENIPFVEDDRWSNYAVDTSAYLFRNGRWTVPEEPGWGIELSGHYDRFAQEEEELVIR